MAYVGILLVAAAFFYLVKRIILRRRAPLKDKLGVVLVDDIQVIFRKPDGSSDQIAWAALAEVGIVTTDQGPFFEDVFFMLLQKDRKSGCAIPQGAKGVDVLLTRLQALPNFDNGELIKAMGSTSNNRFLCWTRT